jgi:hypothetical protein
MTRRPACGSLRAADFAGWRSDAGACTHPRPRNRSPAFRPARFAPRPNRTAASTAGHGEPRFVRPPGARRGRRSPRRLTAAPTDARSAHHTRAPAMIRSGCPIGTCGPVPALPANLHARVMSHMCYVISGKRVYLVPGPGKRGRVSPEAEQDGASPLKNGEAPAKGQLGPGCAFRGRWTGPVAAAEAY